MPRPKATGPTERELEILRVLWDHGPATVREVRARLDQPSGHTGLQKLLTIMLDKGLVTREARGRSHVYRAATSRERTRREVAGDLLERLFGGSAAALVQSALAARPAGDRELAEIRRLLDEAEAAPEGASDAGDPDSNGGDRDR